MHRLAGAALGGEHGDDLAELAARRRRTSADAVEAPATRRRRGVSATRRHGLVELRRCRPARPARPSTPARSACWSSSVDSSSATRIGADLAVRLAAAARRPRRAGRRRRTTGRARRPAGSPVSRSCERRRATSNGIGAARRAAWPAGSRTSGSASTTATGTRVVGLVAMGAGPCLSTGGGSVDGHRLDRYDSGRPVRAVGGELVGGLAGERAVDVERARCGFGLVVLGHERQVDARRRRPRRSCWAASAGTTKVIRPEVVGVGRGVPSALVVGRLARLELAGLARRPGSGPSGTGSGPAVGDDARRRLAVGLGRRRRRRRSAPVTRMFTKSPGTSRPADAADLVDRDRDGDLVVLQRGCENVDSDSAWVDELVADHDLVGREVGDRPPGRRSATGR